MKLKLHAVLVNDSHYVAWVVHQDPRVFAPFIFDGYRLLPSIYGPAFTKPPITITTDKISFCLYVRSLTISSDHDSFIIPKENIQGVRNLVAAYNRTDDAPVARAVEVEVIE